MSALKRSHWLLFAAVLAGVVLRLIWVSDMEYKFDEQWMFQKVMQVGKIDPWPLMGMPSGVQVQNPGMSVWIFIFLGKLIGATDPTELCRAVQVLNVLALGLFTFFALRFVQSREKPAWTWAVALVSVNPIAIVFERKIWAQSVLPIFCVLLLMAWWKRNSRRGSFFWGLLGAIPGQLHMSGFFFTPALVIWTGLFRRKSVHWKSWFLGSFLGVLPLLPWVYYQLTAAPRAARLGSWLEIFELRFWPLWVGDALGLHVGNFLGAQLKDFFRYPVLFGNSTYLVGAAHALLAVCFAIILSLATRRALRERFKFLRSLTAGKGDIGFLVGAAALVFPILMMIALLNIRRYYLIITFPLEWVWISALALYAGGSSSSNRFSRPLLASLFALQLFISANFLGYIHVNGGAPAGDYGLSYRMQHPGK